MSGFKDKFIAIFLIGNFIVPPSFAGVVITDNSGKVLQNIGNQKDKKDEAKKERKKDGLIRPEFSTPQTKEQQKANQRKKEAQDRLWKWVQIDGDPSLDQNGEGNSGGSSGGASGGSSGFGSSSGGRGRSSGGGGGRSSGGGGGKNGSGKSGKLSYNRNNKILPKAPPPAGESSTTGGNPPPGDHDHPVPPGTPPQSFQDWWPVCIFIDPRVNSGNEIVKTMMDMAGDCGVVMVPFVVTIEELPNPDDDVAINESSKKMCNPHEQLGVPDISSMVATPSETAADKMCNSEETLQDGSKRWTTKVAGCAVVRSGVAGGLDTTSITRSQGSGGEQLAMGAPGVQTSIIDKQGLNGQVGSHEAFGHSQMGWPNGKSAGNGIGQPNNPNDQGGHSHDGAYTDIGCRQMKSAAYHDNNGRFSWDPNQKKYFEKAPPAARWPLDRPLFDKGGPPGGPPGQPPRPPPGGENIVNKPPSSTPGTPPTQDKQTPLFTSVGKIGGGHPEGGAGKPDEISLPPVDSTPSGSSSSGILDTGLAAVPPATGLAEAPLGAGLGGMNPGRPKSGGFTYIRDAKGGQGAGNSADSGPSGAGSSLTVSGPGSSSSDSVYVGNETGTYGDDAANGFSASGKIIDRRTASLKEKNRKKKSNFDFDDEFFKKKKYQRKERTYRRKQVPSVYQANSFSGPDGD